jgi:hypothetical protein
MRRRDFIAGLGAAVWPIAARAQQRERVRRIGVLIGGDENDPDVKRLISALTQALAGLGWTDGGNVNRPGRHSASRRHLRGSHSARREAGRSPGAVSDQI